MEKILKRLNTKFQTWYTSGGHFTVCVDVKGVGYLINTDNSIMYCSVDGKLLTKEEIISLYETEEGEAVVRDTNNLVIVADYDNSKMAMVFTIKDEFIANQLFQSYALFKFLSGDEPSIKQKYYISNKRRMLKVEDRIN